MSRRTLITGTLALLATVALIALAGCGSDSSGSTGPRGGELEGRWVLTHQIVGSAMRAVPSDVTIDAAFADGRVSGRSAVNTYSGRYTATAAGDLKVGPLASTQMAGPAAAMAAETAYLAALERVASYRVDGSTLTLYADSGDDLLAFAADTQGVVGSWEVTGYNNGAQAVVSLVPGSTITAAFASDGTLSGNAGVNTYRSDYSTTAGGSGTTTISISPPVTTRTAGPQELIEQEQGYLAALESAATFTVRGDTLELRDGSDAIAVTMTRS